MAVLAATFGLTAYLFVLIPKGFIPNEDNGSILVFTEAAQDISYEAMMAKQQAVAEIVRKNPNVDQFMSFIGASGSNVVPNTGRIFIRLKPRAERPPIEQVIAQLRPQVSSVPGIRVYPQVLPTIRIGGQLTQGAVPVHPARHRSAGALPSGRPSWTTGSGSFPACRT